MTILWIRIFPKDTKHCCKVLGSAMRMIRFKIARSNSFGFSSHSSVRSLRNTVTTANTQLTP